MASLGLARLDNLLAHAVEHLADELLIHEGRVVELEPLGAEPLGEVLLGEKELEQHAHLEVLLREQQRLEARKAELLQPQQRKVAEHEVQRVVGALCLAAVLEVERREEDLEHLLVPHAAVQHLLEEEPVVGIAHALQFDVLGGVRVDGGDDRVEGAHHLLACCDQPAGFHVAHPPAPARGATRNRPRNSGEWGAIKKSLTRVAELAQQALDDADLAPTAAPDPAATAARTCQTYRWWCSLN